jgi:hypothetical protein
VWACQVGGLQQALDCFLAHCLPSTIVEALGPPGKESTELRPWAWASSAGHRLTRGSFDAQLLSLNLLTNCTEKSGPARSQASLFQLRWGQGGADGGPMVDVLPTAATGAGAQGCSSALFMVRYLLQRVQPFQAQLAQVGCGWWGGCRLSGEVWT